MWTVMFHPSHRILSSTYLGVHHVCGAEHAVFLRANTIESKREHAIREFIGARLVVDVLPPRIFLVLVINSWFTLYGRTILFNLFIIAWWFAVFATTTFIAAAGSACQRGASGVVLEACVKRCLLQVCISR